MFDVVRNNKTVVRVFLALIILPFAFWGVDSYVGKESGDSSVAKINGNSITTRQFQEVWRNQQARMRQALGENFKAEELDTPTARLALLNSLIDQKLLLLEATKQGVGASDGMLREVISKIPSLQENAEFSMARYESALRAQGLTQQQFEAQLRDDLSLQQLVGGVAETAVVSKTSMEAMLRIQSEEREVAQIRITPAQFASQLKIEPAAVEKYYLEHRQNFELPEQVRAEFVLLSPEEIAPQIKLKETEITDWYESHKERYQKAEERSASHILLTLNPSISEAEKRSVKQKAEEILKEARQSSANFSMLAKKYSQDPGSANKGGDLGFFPRGVMVKAFEETVFKQKEGDISDLVQSEFGYHIIKLTGVHPAKQLDIASVRADIESELKRQAALRQFADSAEVFSNMVYEQSDSLVPVAERFKLKILQSPWLLKKPSPRDIAALGFMANEKVLSALFSEDTRKNKRNTEALEIAPNTLLAARISEYKPASLRPLREVTPQIEALLRTQEAAALAKKSGEKQLAELKNGQNDKLLWGASEKISRLRSHLSPAASQAIFKEKTAKLPAFVGVQADDGTYSIYKISQLIQPKSSDDRLRRLVMRDYSGVVAQQDFSAYLSALRTRYKIKIDNAALERATSSSSL